MSYNDDALFYIKLLYKDNGFNKNSWIEILKKIQFNCDYDNQIFLFVKNKLVTQPNNILNLDFIDFIFTYGNLNLFYLFSQKEFLMSLFILLKKEHNYSIKIQMEIIYLIQKWKNNFNKNKNYSSFNQCYLYLLNKGIVFPNQEYKLETYNKYILDNEIKAYTLNKQLKNLQDNESYIKDFEKIENKYSDNVIEKVNEEELNNNTNFIDINYYNPNEYNKENKENNNYFENIKAHFNNIIGNKILTNFFSNNN